jgi:pimeloyl-ACP methyl ester carboxylesterase
VTDLVLLHGALGDATQLAPLATRLGDGRRVVVIELEGHGATPLRDRPLRIESFADDVIARLDRQGIARADVFGYSMGGYVALYLAATSSARIARVATLATKLAWTPEVAARESAMLDPVVIRTKVPRFAAALEARHTARAGKRCSRTPRSSCTSSALAHALPTRCSRASHSPFGSASVIVTPR